MEHHFSLHQKRKKILSACGSAFASSGGSGLRRHVKKNAISFPREIGAVVISGEYFWGSA